MLAHALIALVAAIHLYIAILEMFLWNTPRSQRAFGIAPELARQTRTLAANQGLYNGFLVAGLLWGLWLGAEGLGIQVFFLGCVAVAGLFGAVTTSKWKILFVQTIPAALALAVLLASA
ncbi:MAG: DUF1304 domain-containing protein [Comamonas sp.]